jgi:release factor glutamine methyltransferase
VETARDSGAWTVLRVMKWSGEYLEGKGVERGRLDAEHLLAHALDTARLQLYLQYDRPLTAEELDRFRPLLRRRAEREPLQYITGRAAFRELDLLVDRRVLVPRPETEVLVEAVLRWAASKEPAELTALDLGTGSGAIALSLLREGPFRRVVATDASREALEVAGENARRAGLRGGIDLRCGSIYESLEEGERFDVVVSNPPYVAESEAAGLAPEVGVWEPRLALMGGSDGLDVIRRIVDGSARRIRAGGLLALEVGAGQPDAVVATLEATSAYDEVLVQRDLAGRRRVVMGRRAEDAES